MKRFIRRWRRSDADGRRFYLRTSASSADKPSRQARDICGNPRLTADVDISAEIQFERMGNFLEAVKGKIMRRLMAAISNRLRQNQ
ncbi:MAG TPA: hypothetical protein VF713_03930 [Thermoanaerobaculia bacterium]